MAVKVGSVLLTAVKEGFVLLTAVKVDTVLLIAVKEGTVLMIAAKVRAALLMAVKVVSGLSMTVPSATLGSTGRLSAGASFFPFAADSLVVSMLADLPLELASVGFLLPLSAHLARNFSAVSPGAYIWCTSPR